MPRKPSKTRRRLNPAARYAVMSSIRKRDTKPELLLRQSLWAAGLRGWRCYSTKLPGTPDLIFSKARLAVHVDGVWWHGHPAHFKPTRQNAYWRAKIARNKRRDRMVDRQLSALGWISLRFWDVDVLSDPTACVRTIKALVGARRRVALLLAAE